MPRIQLVFLLLLLALVAACGPGWEGYDDQYSDPGPIPSEPWEGEETIFVELDETSVEVPLAGLETRDFMGVRAVLLADVVVASGLTPNPESYWYDFTATDGYNLFQKRYEDKTLLPGWVEMAAGYLYFDARFDDLTTGWTQHPWGGALSAYQVKWMNEGAITLLPVD